MLQCVETSHSESRKDSVGGGRTTVTTYTYSVEWKSSYVDSNSFHKTDSQNWRDNCGVHNPEWPATLPRSGTQYVDTVKAGSFVLTQPYVQDVPLTKVVWATSTPNGWSVPPNAEYYEQSEQQTNRHHIGKTRVTFLGTDWSQPRVTAL